MVEVHSALDATLGDESLPALERIRAFFATVKKGYREQGYMGCLLGGLGQELSGISETFRQKVSACFEAIGQRFAQCLELARRQGEIPSTADPQKLAALLVDCWEGAALRSRLRGNPAPLDTMLDFYFQAVVG